MKISWGYNKLEMLCVSVKIGSIPQFSREIHYQPRESTAPYTIFRHELAPTNWTIIITCIHRMTLYEQGPSNRERVLVLF